ncbi:MAG: PEP-utilizing enzyme [Candidatus Margulisiibacteriota bacterium]|jgi:phosphoenolpyruvate synthase/pyruvate phosphate dikinase
MKIPQLSKSYNVFTKDYTSNSDWYEKSWSGVLNPLFLVGYGCVYYINKRVSDTYRSAFCYLKNDRLHWFWDNRDLERVRERILKIIKTNPSQIERWYKQWERDWAVLEKVYKKLDKIDLKILPPETIYELYEELKEAYIFESTLPYLVDSFLSNKETDWYLELLTKELTKLKVKNIEESLATFTLPVYNSFSQQELLELLQICLKIIKNKSLLSCVQNKNIFTKKVLSNKNLLNLFNLHQSKFYWIENSYFDSSSLTVIYFVEKARKLFLEEKDILKKYKIERDKSKNLYKKNLLIKKLKLNLYFKKLIKYTDIFTKWQDTRKSGVFRTNHYIFKILNELARRYKIDKKDICFTYDPEMKDLILYGKIDKNKVRSRQKGCAFFVCRKGWKFFENSEFKKIDLTIFEKVSKNVKIIKGVTACPGKVIGKARVILNIKDLSKLKKGEILVTNNTTPDFVPAMKKAGAIITEQGGITTHAAIVSRELNKPCIIGTKIATKVLKDGDMVEVNANHGVVTIIKSK